MIFEDKDTILFIGDSIGDYDRAHPFGDGDEAWGTSYIQSVASLLQSTYPEKRYRIVNVCTSGNQSRDLVARWKTDVLDNHPDWVCVMIGINDVWRQFDCPDRPYKWYDIEHYEQALEKMVTDTLSHVKGMVLMTPYFMEQNKQDAMRATMDAYGDVVKRIARKYDILAIDIQKAWDDYFAQGGLHYHAICWDGIHPGIVGRMVLARAFLKATGYEW